MHLSSQLSPSPNSSPGISLRPHPLLLSAGESSGQSEAIACTKWSVSPPSHHRDPITNTCSPLKLVPTRGIPVTGFNHRISQWSAWRCKTCCVAQCPGGRPRHRPPRWQCTRQTTWNSSPYPACQAPPPQPLGELHPAGAAVLQGWSPRWGSSAGSPAADGNPCLLARACDP